jgi:glycosyltransferase involved in cell wall biosynthesis
MRIAIDARIINSTTGSYVERLLHYLELIDRENSYIVLVPTKDKDFWQPTNPRFKIQTVDFKNYSLAEQVGFKTYLDDLAPDLVHFCMPQQPVLYKGAHVTTFHDLTLLNTYNSDKNWLVYHAKQLVGRYVFRKVAHTSRHILVPTEYTKQAVVEALKVTPDKITVTYESADKANGALKPFKHPFKQFILYVGQQSDYKNIKRLGDAHQQLLQAHPDLGLILVGKKNDAIRANEAYFTKKEYSNILFTDFIPDEQRDWLYSQAAAYIFPSLMEGFGLPGLEAMGYGVPVVSSNATCLPEVYGDAAHYFNPLDSNDIARAINDVLTNETLAQNLVQKGFKQLDKYSWQRMAEQTHEVYLKSGL